MAHPTRTRERRWAFVRIILGTLQTIGAFTIVMLVLQTGASALTVAVAVITACLVVVSRLLFRAK